MIIVLASLAAFVITAVGVPLVRSLVVRHGIVDVANDRSSHVGVVPRGAGVAVAAGMLAGLAIGGPSRELGVVAVGAAVLGIVGLIDDRVGLRVSVRLATQLVVAVVTALVVLAPDRTLDAALAGSLVVAVVWLVGYVNSFNFMDGINAISVAQATVAGTLFVVLGSRNDLDDVALGGAVLVGAFLGFLPYNAPTARIFLGDVGSYFAGFWIAGLALLSVHHGIPAEIVVVPCLLYVVDTVTTVVVRARAGDRIGEAHRDHAYQRLARAWRSHVAVSAMAAAVIGLASALAIAAHDSSAPTRTVVLGVALLLAAGFVVAGRRWERTA